MNIIKHIGVSTGMLILVCCTKKDDDLKQTTKQLLVNKHWQITAISATLSDGLIIPDDFSGLESYKKDDYYLFRDNLTFEVNDNLLLRPSASSPIIIHGTWKLVRDDFLILNSSGPGTLYDTMQIVKITPDKLVIHQESQGKQADISFKVSQ